MCFSNRYHLNGIFLHPVYVFLSLKFDAFEDGFWGWEGAWGQNPLLRHHCPGQLTIGRIPPDNAKLPPNIQEQGATCAKHTKKPEKLEKLSAREWIKENMDLPQIHWWPDFTNTTENTLNSVREAIKLHQLKKIENWKGFKKNYERNTNTKEIVGGSWRKSESLRVFYANTSNEGPRSRKWLQFVTLQTQPAAPIRGRKM